MKSSELEQKIRENSFRISKLSEMLNKLQEENAELRKHLENISPDMARDSQNTSITNNYQTLSDELYDHIGKQTAQVVSHADRINENLSTRIQQLSDELYHYIDNQDKQIIQLAEKVNSDSSGRTQKLSDSLYEYINWKAAERDKRLAEYQENKKAEDWMITFGFDNMISEMQLYEVEQRIPGNRKKIEAIQNSHKGEKCFVIGNGPSLKADDLTALKEKHFFSLASKGIYNIFDETDWRPDIWGVSDLDYIKLKEKDISNLSGFPKFVCAQAILKHNIEIRDAIYYPFIQAERQPCFFNKDITRGIHFYGTITGKLINIAVYMGFTEIYLLGCDHTLPMKIDENGKKVVDTSVNSHFNNKYFSSEQERSQVYKNVIDAEKAFQYTTQAYADIKYHCEQLGVKIYNASRESALEAYPHINFDEVIH